MDPNVNQQVDEFFAQYPLRHYPKGQMLIQAGENPSSIYRLLDGRVKQYDISYRGDEVIVNVFKPPAFFPMSYAINRTANQYFFQADADVTAQVAPVGDTLTFLKSHPDVAFDLLSRVYRGADGLLGRLVHLMAGSARSRLLYELLIEGRRFGRAVPEGTAIPVTESDLAARAGLARETVSRELAKLKREDFIQVTNDGLVITDLRRLSQAVGDNY